SHRGGALRRPRTILRRGGAGGAVSRGDDPLPPAPGTRHAAARAGAVTARRLSTWCPMITCERLRELATEYLDGRLRPRHRQLAASHLASCERCRVAIRDTETLKGWLRDSEPPAAPPAFWDATLAQIRADAAAPPRPVPQLRRWQRATGWATAAAALALALLAPLRIQYWRDNGPANTRHVIGWHANYAARWPLADQGQMRVVALRA